MSKHPKLAFTAGAQPTAQASLKKLKKKYGDVDIDDADVIVALGGDGLMLSRLQSSMHDGRPIYGMNRGRIGFLMNNYHEEDLLDHICSAISVVIHPLSVKITHNDKVDIMRAINEAAVFRATHQAAHLSISINEKLRMEELVSDGLMVATPAGSTAYNYSAHGPILPLGSQLLALTPISPFRPRRWRGALLHHEDIVRITVLNSERRSVNASADNLDFYNVSEIEVRADQNTNLTLLFDRDQPLDERILQEQFATD